MQLWPTYPVICNWNIRYKIQDSSVKTGGKIGAIKVNNKIDNFSQKQKHKNIITAD